MLVHDRSLVHRDDGFGCRWTITQGAVWPDRVVADTAGLSVTLYQTQCKIIARMTSRREALNFVRRSRPLAKAAISYLGTSPTPAARARRGVRHAGVRETCTVADVGMIFMGCDFDSRQ